MYVTIVDASVLLLDITANQINDATIRDEVTLLINTPILE
jgi:hypothetical protein